MNHPALVLDAEERGGADVYSVLRAGDAEVFCELAGAFEALAGADEDALGEVLGSGDDVEQPVYAVAEVDIDRAAGTVEHFGAFGAAAVSVAGAVLNAAVDLGLGYYEAALLRAGETADEGLAHELRRYLQRVPEEKFPAEPHFRTYSSV